MKYREKSVEIEAITFDELVRHGIDSGANLVNGMPWSFSYRGYPITHEHDSCYLIPSLRGSERMGRDDMLVTASSGEVYVCGPNAFAALYEPIPTNH